MASALITTGCVIDPYTGEEKVSKTVWGGVAGTAVGAASGAAIGAIAGGKKGAALGAGIGAGVGGVTGAGVGYYMDYQEAKLRAQLAGTGVSIQRQGDDLKLIMPGNITFSTGSASINGNFYPVLDSVALVLVEYEKTTIRVAGFTDSVGSESTNQELSERRADSVANYIATSGVMRGRIQSYGVGERSPLASNATNSGRSQNRRVEISISAK